MHQPSVSASTDATQVYSRKWRIGGVLSLDLSPALLDLEARSKTKLFPLRPPGGQGCPIPLNCSPNV